MKIAKRFVISIICALVSWAPSFAQESGSINFAPTSPIKVAFPVPGSILLFFYSSRCGSCNQNLEVYALTPQGDFYKRLYVGSLDTDGDPPKIESVFLKDVDGKPGGELFILASWISSHSGAGISTKNYAVYVFGRELSGKGGLKRLANIEGKIGQTSEGTVESNDGRPERVTAKYRNADDVRRILKDIGY